MLNPQVETMLANLKNAMEVGVLTPTNKAECGTLVCVTQKTPQGIAYDQLLFDSLPLTMQAGLKGREKGTMHGGFKIVAVYDIWEPGSCFGEPGAYPYTFKRSGKVGK